MFEPHSFLWHYLWVGPNVLLLCVAALFYRRGLHHRLPVFLTFAVVEGVLVLATYAIDLMPSVFSTMFWWEADSAQLLVEVVLKFALLGEIFSSVFKHYAAISRLGRAMIRGVGGALVLAAGVVAGFAHPGSAFWIVSANHLLSLADFMVECGLLVFIFLFTAYFRLAWPRLVFGIALGRGIAASMQLATWAFLANVKLFEHARHLLDFVNMGAYHVCVLIWLYYVLTTPKWVPKVAFREGDDDQRDHDASAEERQKNLDVWNRELERLLRR